MKSFLKNVLANIVAVFIILFVGFIMLIGIIAISAVGDSSTVKVKKNSVLTLNLRTNIIDSPSDEREDIFSFGDKQNYVVLYDAVEAIKAAKTDNNIKGISIEADYIGAGITQLDNLRTAIEDFKKSGKFVTTYGNNVSQGTYFLGSVADQYYLHPAGGIDLRGMSAEVMFFKEFADKYGIGVEVIRHGKYKSAVEPYLRNDLSDENKEQLSVMISDIWNNISGKIQRSRKVSANEYKLVVDSLYTVIPDNNLKFKTVDKLVQKSEYDAILKQKLKVKKEDKLNKISLSNYVKSIKSKTSENKIGVLYASGEILTGEGYDAIYSVSLIKEIQKLAKDKEVKAVVLRVNSPGGSANASDEILFELQELKKKKPLVVSFGDYAASGGYYIAMAGERIFSEPNTLTGSIGVFGMIPYFKEIANKNGIYADAVSTNANSNSYSAVNGLSPGFKTILTKSVEQTYKRFVHFVTVNRKKSFAQIDEVGGGRVWSGTRAKELGLVDQLGSLNDAVAYAGQRVKLKEYQVVSYPKKVSLYEQIFSDMNPEEMEMKMIKRKIGEDKFKIFETLTNPKLNNSVMMESPYRINF